MIFIEDLRSGILLVSQMENFLEVLIKIRGVLDADIGNKIISSSGISYGRNEWGASDGIA